MTMFSRRAIAGLLVLTSVSGCAWWQERSRTTKGAVYGSGAGAAAGAAIGGILGGGEGAWKGAAIGAAVGGLGGGAAGYYMDRQAKEMEEVLARQDRVEREGEMLRVALSSDVLFSSGSAKLQSGADDKLRQVASVLQRYPRTRVEIAGHTDNVGSDSFNNDLSERRATAVKDVLLKAGVDPGRITTVGLGESRPVSSNDNASGRLMNRRVELTIAPEAGTASGETGEAAPSPAPEEPH